MKPVILAIALITAIALGIVLAGSGMLAVLINTGRGNNYTGPVLVQGETCVPGTNHRTSIARTDFVLAQDAVINRIGLNFFAGGQYGPDLQMNVVLQYPGGEIRQTGVTFKPFMGEFSVAIDVGNKPIAKGVSRMYVTPLFNDDTWLIRWAAADPTKAQPGYNSYCSNKLLLNMQLGFYLSGAFNETVIDTGAEDLPDGSLPTLVDGEDTCVAPRVLVDGLCMVPEPDQTQLLLALLLLILLIIAIIVFLWSVFG